MFCDWPALSTCNICVSGLKARIMNHLDELPGIPSTTLMDASWRAMNARVDTAVELPVSTPLELDRVRFEFCSECHDEAQVLGEKLPGITSRLYGYSTRRTHAFLPVGVMHHRDITTDALHRVRFQHPVDSRLRGYAIRCRHDHSARTDPTDWDADIFRLGVYSSSLAFEGPLRWRPRTSALLDPMKLVTYQEMFGLIAALIAVGGSIETANRWLDVLSSAPASRGLFTDPSLLQVADSGLGVVGLYRTLTSATANLLTESPTPR